MNIEYISDTGSRHEWRCAHCDSNYVVTFHYLDGAWSVQRVRDDGQREILDRNVASELLDMFPQERALSMTHSDTELATGRNNDAEPLPFEDRKGLGLDATSRAKTETASDPDANTPAA